MAARDRRRIGPGIGDQLVDRLERADAANATNPSLELSTTAITTGPLEQHPVRVRLHLVVGRRPFVEGGPSAIATSGCILERPLGERTDELVRLGPRCEHRSATSFGWTGSRAPLRC